MSWSKGKTAAAFLAALMLGTAGGAGVYLLRGHIGNPGSSDGQIQVSFECNAGTDEIKYAPETQWISRGGASTCPPFPVREGYIFDGWYLDEDCREPYSFGEEVSGELVLYAGWLKADSAEAQLTQEDIQEFAQCTEALSEAVRPYEKADGTVEAGMISEAMDEAEGAVKEQKEAGAITYYSRQDDTIYMEFASGLTYLYHAVQQDTLAGGKGINTVAAFPFYGVKWAWNNPQGVADGEDVLQQILESFSDVTKLYGETIAYEKEFFPEIPDGCQVLAWDGHGHYCQELGPVLLTSEAESLGEALGSAIGNQDVYLRTKMVTMARVGGRNVYALTPEYLRIFLPTMDEGIVYLSACRSGQDDRLAEAFLVKGAQVVIANKGTEDINTGYSQAMAALTFSYMNGPYYYSVEKALARAKNEWNSRGRPQYPNVGPDIFVREPDAKNYTLWAGIRGTLTAPEGEEAPEWELYDLTLRDSEGEVLAFTIPEADGSFAFHRLEGEEGLCRIEISCNDVLLQTVDASIQPHRYRNLGEIQVKRPDYFAEYGEVVKAYEAEYGTFELRNLGWCVYGGGVNYLQLLDMDGNGTMELLIGYMDSFNYDYTLEVWACQGEEAVCVGKTGYYMEGAEEILACTGKLDGIPCVITGNYISGYSGWFYDGGTLSSRPCSLEDMEEIRLVSINEGSTDREEERGQMLHAWETLLEVKEQLVEVSDYEKAMVSYKFELIYGEPAGYYASRDATQSPRFEYVYIDEDEIPELVIAPDGIHATAAYLYTYYEGQTVCLGQFGVYGSFYYSPKRNLIQQHDTHQGVIWNRFGKIEEGKYVAVREFQAGYQDYSYTVPDSCQIDGEKVSFEVYTEELSAMQAGHEFSQAGYSTGTEIRQEL